MMHLECEAPLEAHPWQPLVGMCADDPDWDAFQASMRQYREDLDRSGAEA